MTEQKSEHALSKSVVKRLEAQGVSQPSGAVEAALRMLDSLRDAEDEPDFMHSITKSVHQLAREIIENVYARSAGSAPTLAAAPDGDGGVVVEWKSGKREVRLVLAA